MTTKEKVVHTPGPWRLGGSYNENLYATLVEHNYTKPGSIKHIAQIQADVDGLKYGYTVEQQGNARLIAAAPDLLKERDKLRQQRDEMLEALERLDAELVDGQNIPSLAAMERIRAAIRRAKGESQ